MKKNNIITSLFLLCSFFISLDVFAQNSLNSKKFSGTYIFVSGSDGGASDPLTQNCYKNMIINVNENGAHLAKTDDDLNLNPTFADVSIPAYSESNGCTSQSGMDYTVEICNTFGKSKIKSERVFSLMIPYARDNQILELDSKKNLKYSGIGNGLGMSSDKDFSCLYKKIK